MLSPLDAAWSLIKQNDFTFGDIAGSMDSGAFRAVYPHPTDSNKVVKIPHGELDEASMTDVASNRALNELGEPTVPETITTIPRDVKRYQDDTRGSGYELLGSVNQPIFTQELMPNRTVQDTLRDMSYGDRQATREDTQVIYDALRQFKNTDTDGPNPTFTNTLAGDLHDKNLGFKLPDAAVRRLVDERDTEGLTNALASFDAQGMLRHSSKPEGRYGANAAARMMQAKQIDPEKLNRFIELFGDRSQFDSLMDTMVHQPNNVLERESHPQVNRIQRREREGVESAYNAYIQAVNNAKRTKSYIDDPYQTRLGEYDRDFRDGDSTQPHPSTILREAIIRTRANQAKEAMNGLRGQLRDNQIDARDDLTQDFISGQQAKLRNDFGASLPMVRRLLGREQEKQKLAALHQNVMEGYLPMARQQRYGGHL